VPSWKGGEKTRFVNGDSSSDVKEISQQSSSDIKQPDSDVAMDSNAGDPMAISTPMASSPPAAPGQPAAITAHWPSESKPPRAQNRVIIDEKSLYLERIF
jgi:hypothetical protein